MNNFTFIGGVLFLSWAMTWGAYLIAAATAPILRMSKGAVWQSQTMKYLGIILMVVGLIKDL